MALSETGPIKKTRKSFTLLELICVLAISALLIGLVAGRVGKVPAYLSFKNAVFNISEILNQASDVSQLSGKEVALIYENGNFFPKNKQIQRLGSRLNYQIPEFVDVRFNTFAPEKKQFVFFPDGSSSGPEMYFSFKGHTASLSISKLTGMPILKINE